MIDERPPPTPIPSAGISYKPTPVLDAIETALSVAVAVLAVAFIAAWCVLIAMRGAS